MATVQETGGKATEGSQQPVPEWITNMYAAIDAFDVERFLTYLAPDCEFRFGNAPSVFGLDAIGAGVSGLFGALNSIRHQEIEAWEDANKAVASGIVTYTRRDDSTLTVPWAVIFHLEGGLVSRYLIYINDSQLFA